MQHTNYKADTKNNVVIAELNDTKSYMTRISDDTGKDFRDYYMLDLKTENYDTWKGIAKCDPKDKFDIQYGKKLASTRADLKYHKALIDDYRKFRRYILLHNLSIVNELIQKETKTIDKLNKHLDKILKESDK